MADPIYQKKWCISARKNWSFSHQQLFVRNFHLEISIKSAACSAALGTQPAEGRFHPALVSEEATEKTVKAVLGQLGNAIKRVKGVKLHKWHRIYSKKKPGDDAETIFAGGSTLIFSNMKNQLSKGVM